MAGVMTRILNEEMVLHGYRVPADVSILVSVLHHLVMSEKDPSIPS